MRRIPIQLDEAVYRALKERAAREQRSIADLVREGIARNEVVTRRTLDDFPFVGSGTNAADRRGRVSERHDAALAAAFSSRRRQRRK